MGAALGGGHEVHADAGEIVVAHAAVGVEEHHRRHREGGRWGQDPEWWPGSDGAGI